MPSVRTLFDEQRTGDERSDSRTVARKFDALNVRIGMLGSVGPAVKGNDDRGLIDTKRGPFLGVIAVNAGHNLLHVVVGVLGVQASRDATSSRRYMAFSAAFFGPFAAVVWRKLGFDREIIRSEESP